MKVLSISDAKIIRFLNALIGTSVNLLRQYEELSSVCCVLGKSCKTTVGLDNASATAFVFPGLYRSSFLLSSRKAFQFVFGFLLFKEYLSGKRSVQILILAESCRLFRNSFKAQTIAGIFFSLVGWCSSVSGRIRDKQKINNRSVFLRQY